MEINVNLSAGKYILAVSGGVDSIVLFDLLTKQNSDIELIIAHYDHGIREDSVKDAKLVEKLAKKTDLKFEIEQGKLGSQVSEAEARDKRYDFLNRIKDKYQAKAIITAHHQDDLIETSIINIIRGTGRRGLTSLKSRKDIIRPLLPYPKSVLIKYATVNKLKWQEDSTNLDKKYLRNQVRLEIIPKMDDSFRIQWLNILAKAEEINNQIDKELNRLLYRGLHKNQLVLNRNWFIMLPHDIAKEVVIELLVKAGSKEIDKKTIERLAVQIKTLPAGKTIQAVGIDVLLTKRSARFKNR